jgi:hypothetical protein
VSLSTSPAIGSDGRLADATLNTGSADASEGPDGCSAALGAGGPPPWIQETPGTYHWQVWRLCTGCERDYEVGPVRKLTLRSPVKPSLRAPGRAYAGYPFFVTARAAGAPDGTKATVKRLALALAGHGNRPRRRGRGRGRAAARDAPGPGQPHDRRAAGGERGAAGDGAPRPAPEHRAAADGRYRGRAGPRSVRLEVTGRGRQVRDFRAFVPMLCPGISPGQFTTQIGTATVRRARIAPDGRFVAASTPGRETAISLRGRLRGRRVSGGRAKLSVSNCSGSASFKAGRAG